MKFRNYCVIIMGETKDCLVEIRKVSENEPNFLNAGGIFIATFTSAVEPKEMDSWFKLNQRNFMFFDLNPENSGYNILKKDINDGLFGFISKQVEDNSLQSRADKFLDEIVMSSETKTKKERIKKEIVIEEKLVTKEEISLMGEKEKNILMNEIIDEGTKIGFENLSKEKKKILQILAK